MAAFYIEGNIAETIRRYGNKFKTVGPPEPGSLVLRVARGDDVGKTEEEVGKRYVEYTAPPDVCARISMFKGALAVCDDSANYICYNYGAGAGTSFATELSLLLALEYAELLSKEAVPWPLVARTIKKGRRVLVRRMVWKPKVKKVPKFDAEGNVVLNDLGMPAFDEIPVLNEAGEPVLEWVQDCDIDDIPLDDPVPEFQELLDERGNPMRDEAGEVMFAPKLDAERNPVRNEHGIVYRPKVDKNRNLVLLVDKPGDIYDATMLELRHVSENKKKGHDYVPPEVPKKEEGENYDPIEAWKISSEELKVLKAGCGFEKYSGYVEWMQAATACIGMQMKPDMTGSDYVDGCEPNIEALQNLSYFNERFGFELLSRAANLVLCKATDNKDEEGSKRVQGILGMTLVQSMERVFSHVRPSADGHVLVAGLPWYEKIPVERWTDALGKEVYGDRWESVKRVEDEKKYAAGRKYETDPRYQAYIKDVYSMPL